jgi:Ca2+-binding RTX toxin-like protein
MHLCDGDDLGHLTRRVLIPALIDGKGGDDKLRSGGGDDTVLGGCGDGKLWAATGNDSLDGGDGDDKLSGGQGSDTLVGGKGCDQIKADGGAGHDDIHDGCGGNGNDGATQTVFADADIDTLTGSQGTDAFWANLVADNGGAIDVLMDKASNETTSDIDL